MTIKHILAFTTVVALVITPYVVFQRQWRARQIELWGPDPATAQYEVTYDGKFASSGIILVRDRSKAREEIIAFNEEMWDNMTEAGIGVRVGDADWHPESIEVTKLEFLK